MDKPIIKLEHVTKDYIIFKTNRQRANALLFGRKTGIQRRVLEDINLEVMPGENIAVIGTVGSGRTTLLKLIAGLTEPSEGRLEVNTRPNIMLDPKAGFDMGLSGRNNITAKASLQGWSKAQIKEKEDELITFAGIEKYADLPMKTYAHGMSSRLGFAIHTCFKSELFLMDESFSVGNSEQKEKCYQRLEEYANNPDTSLIIVSKLPAVIKRFCPRAIVIHEGKLVFDGPSNEALAYFRKNCRQPNKETSEEDEMDKIAIDLQSEDDENEEEYGM